MNKTIGMELRAVGNLMRRERCNSKLARECDLLTGMHGYILGYLFEKTVVGEVFQKDIEAYFEMRRSTATETLKLMERNGLIERFPVEYDARLKSIKLTDYAMEIHDRVMEECVALDAKMSRGITREEMEVFFRVTEKIKANLSDEI